jgi:cysteine desulfurase
MKEYLDFNATTPVYEESVAEIKKYLDVDFGNAGSRTHQSGLDAKKAVVAARNTVASYLDAETSEIVFTSGATESNNLALFGLLDEAKKLGKSHIISTEIEHKAVLDPLSEITKQGFNVTLIAPNDDGSIDIDKVTSSITNQTFLVSCMHANNETGAINAINEIALSVKSINADIYFHTDCAQTFGKTNLVMNDKNIDLLSFSAHKFHGPKGIGGLLMRKRNDMSLPIKPLMYGGGQERGVRPGTHPVALIAGMAKSLEISIKNQDQWNAKCKEIKSAAINSFKDIDYKIYGTTDERTLPNTLSIAFSDLDAEAVILTLKEHAEIATGSACTSDSYTPSHVISSMGASEIEAQRVVRFSWGSETNPEVFKSIATSLKSLL